MTQALYRKYRSRSLDELIGQEHVTGVLKRAIERQQLSHAYLLTGPRGVGKTSIARILAHEINGIAYKDDATDLDIIEIDAASNRRIDDIRELRERVHVAPSHAKYKVYIIDEVHMLTGESFNALLKTLEEPPAHVIFILATTEIDKLPATITSRTQTYHFRRIPAEIMKPHLRLIADKESIAIDDDALDVIANASEGSMRDAETALDQVRHSSSGTITREDAEAALGNVPGSRVDALFASVRAHDAASVAGMLKAFELEGVAATSLTRELNARLLSSEMSIESLNLLDALLEVPKSYSPSIKLFSVLMRTTTLKKSVALAAASAVIKQEIKAVEPIQQQSRPKPLLKPAPKVVAAPEPERVPVSNVPARQVENEPFDWDSLIAHIKKNYIALHSVISTCQYTYDGEILTVYCKFNLHKNKLEDPKYRTMLNEALVGLTGSSPEVTFIFGAKPITNAGLADIAAIMGGGEEVKEGI